MILGENYVDWVSHHVFRPKNGPKSAVFRHFQMYLNLLFPYQHGKKLLIMLLVEPLPPFKSNFTLSP